MTEFRCTLIMVHDQLSHLREEGIDSIVADPWRTLVRLPEATDGISVVKVLETLAIGTCLRRPHVHAKGHRSSRKRVSVTEAEVGMCAL